MLFYFEITFINDSRKEIVSTMGPILIIMVVEYISLDL